jgi:hypothetical protein
MAPPRNLTLNALALHGITRIKEKVQEIGRDHNRVLPPLMLTRRRSPRFRRSGRRVDRPWPLGDAAGILRRQPAGSRCERRFNEVWDRDRLTPLVAGLAEVMPWV